MTDITLYFTSLGAGIVSFISPCSLALLPAFLSYILTTAKNRRDSFFMSILYAIGFSVTFAVIGIVFLAGIMSLRNRVTLNIMAGSITIILAVYVFFNREIQKLTRQWKKSRKKIRLIEVNAANYVSDNTNQTLDSERTDANDPSIEKEPDEQPSSEKTPYSKYGGAFILGLSTGSSWIACVTPVFTTIVAIGSVQGDYATALYLMVIYGIGIMVPFIIIGTLMGTINAKLLAKVIRIGAILERVFALLLLWIGIEMLLSAFNLPGLLAAF